MDPKRFAKAFNRIVDNINTVIHGKDDVVRMSMTAICAGGHILFEDVPGVGKSMLARAIGQSMRADMSRVQCTPDMLPGDITGSSVIDTKSMNFVFRPGPVFANVLLVDEINRATPKTQSALLEAMAERNVTVDGGTHPLPAPFLGLGAGPRASIALLKASKVAAAADGRELVYPEDVKSLLRPVLGHRMMLTPDAVLRGETIDNVLERVVGRIKPPLGVEAPSGNG